ncbi:MAG: transcription termination/antitermination protein NusG [Alphaproteobacteria bacterium]|nr:transcription termination/antitermination protein NusG [Alphaproteobacteria bacterium]
MAARWYIIHAHSGFEKKVAQSIQEQFAQHGLSDKLEEVVVPTEEVVEVRRGKKVAAERKFFPGYVMIKMELNDRTWHFVKNTQKVTGFLGGGGRPQPIPQAEVDRIFAQIKEGIEKPRSTVIYEIGESVKVIDGPFDSFVGVVEDVEEEKARIKVSVSIFGRSTPVELEYSQVEKIA